MAQLSITIDQADALIDVARHIRIEGAQPGEAVEISAETPRSGVLWRAQARFIADAQGAVDLNRDAPVSGSYAGVDGMGLVWSQSPVASTSRELFNQPVTDALVTSLQASSGTAQAQARFSQQLAAPGVTRREVREDGLVGTLYLPAGAGLHRR